jgi:hypothetical protein
MESRESLLAFLISIAIGIAIQLFLEGTNRADSIGWWYTIYSAVVYAVPIFVLIKLGTVWRRRRAQRTYPGGNPSWLPGNPNKKTYRFGWMIRRIVLSIIVGGAGWLGIAWLLALAADEIPPTSALRNFFKIVLAATSPLTFGTLVWLVLTVVVFLVLQLRARGRKVNGSLSEMGNNRTE